MRIKKIFLGLVILSHITFSSPENLARSINIIDGYKQSFIVEDYEISVARLLAMTAMMESRFGLDNYAGRIAKGVYQLEETTQHHYIGLVANEINRIRSLDLDSDTRNAYLVYYSKLHFHKDVALQSLQDNDTCDNEWVVYKALWNTNKGASTFDKWEQRRTELRGL